MLYGGAHRFQADASAKLGALARTAMERWGADDVTFGLAVGVDDPSLAARVAARVRHKLATRPIEALCIDFEDGFGARSDEEEDAEARRAAAALASSAAGVSEGGEKRDVVVGIRIKSFARATFRRAVRTLDLFLGELGVPPPGFTVTLPKVTSPDEVGALVDLLEAAERRLGLPQECLGVELMIETPAALLDPRGGLAVGALVLAARSRAVALHLGAYDLTAELGVTAGDQRLDHPYCDLARMLVRLATPIPLADGATTTLPLAPQGRGEEEQRTAVHRAWKLHAEGVTRAIDLGIWQGWDLHPAQLPARYGALYAHFFRHRDALADRLARFLAAGAQATRVGQAFDDAATAQAALAFFVRGYDAGAFDLTDLAAAGLDRRALKERSLAAIAAATIAPR